MVVGAVIGNILESNGIVSQERIGPRGITAIKLTYLALFCLMAFAIVPLALRLFIVMQVKIGNGELALIKWFQTHEQAVVYSFWSMMVIGICLIYFLAKEDILKNFR